MHNPKSYQITHHIQNFCLHVLLHYVQLFDSPAFQSRDKMRESFRSHNTVKGSVWKKGYEYAEIGILESTSIFLDRIYGSGYWINWSKWLHRPCPWLVWLS